jgi:hypothetical protein
MARGDGLFDASDLSSRYWLLKVVEGDDDGHVVLKQEEVEVTKRLLPMMSLLLMRMWKDVGEVGEQM